MSRRRVCGRNLEAGPGSCWHWWDGCPASVEHCIMRFIEANRDAAGDPDTEQAALARWQAKRLGPQRTLF